MHRALYLFALGLAVLPLDAAEWQVGSGQRFARIRDALAAASAGDTITVHGGVYRGRSRSSASTVPGSMARDATK
jgi:hypothetical protein